jgi:hypothetical protein
MAPEFYRHEAADTTHPYGERVIGPEPPLGSEHNCAQCWKTRGPAGWLQSVSARALSLFVPQMYPRKGRLPMSEEVARVRRCEPAATDADGRLRTSLDGLPGPDSKSVVNC